MERAEPRPFVVPGVVEFFRGLVDEAAEQQGATFCDLTRYYLVQLLARFTHIDKPEPEEPIAFKLGRALNTGGFSQKAMLREVGDLALFLTGYFQASLTRRVVNVDYYARFGCYAYGLLAESGDHALRPVYTNLSHNFIVASDVLCGVSERTMVHSDHDLLRLYDRLVAGSDHSFRQLIQRGILPTHPARGRIQ